MILHIANKNYSSWSLRPWVLLTALEIPFEEHFHWFDDPFEGFSPTAQVPCLVDGDITVWDSLGIAEYVAESFPRVWPEDRAARAFARSAAAEMHSAFSALRTQCSMNCGVRIELHAITDALAKDVARLDSLWSEGLERFGGPFLAGSQFTAVDAFFAPVAFRMQTYGLTLSAPCLAYAERLRALPAMEAWYAAGLAETKRDVKHDVEFPKWGVIVEDLRR